VNRLGIAGLGVIGPGIGSWCDAVALLTGAESFSAQSPMPQAVRTSLPANERRRVSPMIRMVLQCCEETLADCSFEFPAVRSVFASSCGDLVVVDKILRALAMSGKPVSPTHFLNSVHNSVAGYFSIARGDCSSSISVSAHDSSFVAGLLSAAGLVLSGAGPTLLVAYDCTAPPALAPFRPFLASFAVGMLLTDSLAPWSMSIKLLEGNSDTVLRDPALEAMRLGNPAARALPLLELLAADRTGEVALPYLSDLNAVIDIESHDAG